MKLLVLGAGVYQLPIIRRARALDHEVIVCSRPGGYPGFAEASRCHYVDTTDAAGCLAIARAEGIHGVASPGTDVSLGTLGVLVDALGLKGPRASATAITIDKSRMKACFLEAGIPTPRAIQAVDLEDARSAAASIGYPIMLKVVDSSGSRGIIKVLDEATLPAAYADCLAATRASHILVEEFVEGTEFGAQSFVQDGKIVFVMPHGDMVANTDIATVPVGHFVPFPLPRAVEAQVQDIVAATVRAVGLDDCALNFDFILRGEEVLVLEVGARSGATCLSEMVSAHYGMDYYGWMIRAALGEAQEWDFQPGLAVAASLLTSPQTGLLRAIPAPPTAPDVVDYAFDYAVGECVRRFSVGPDRIGHVVVTAGGASVATNRLRQVLDSLHLSIDRGQA
ncbi:MAG: ATP-grasp domain-containing protein [Thermomonas sp.]